MKKQKLFILFSIVAVCLSGCSKTEKDISFNTELYGTYSNNWEVPEFDYQEKYSYTFNEDNTYHGTYFENNNGKISNEEKDAEIINIEDINKDIEKITTDEKRISFLGEEYPTRDFYKYKNMLGMFYETEVPNSKTFDLFLQNELSDLKEGQVFNKDGYYHYCSDYDNCTHDSSAFTKYKHKGKYIYQADLDGNWRILCYVVKDGLFIKDCAKDE